MQITCSFKEMGEQEPAIPCAEGDKKKFGRYSGGNLNVEGFGHKNWVVLAYIVPDRPIREYLDEGFTKQQIVEGCVDFLNQPPTKRARKPRYGKLSCNAFYFLGKLFFLNVNIPQKM